MKCTRLFQLPSLPAETNSYETKDYVHGGCGVGWGFPRSYQRRQEGAELAIGDLQLHYWVRALPEQTIEAAKALR